MCGICGTTLESRSALGAGRRVHAERARGEVETMVNSLGHRGPGDRTVHSAPGAVLGFARLHVTDPQAESGPYGTADGRVVAAVNGEVWNHAELRALLASRGASVPPGPDTAIVAPLYAAFGVAGLSRLRGMFALAIHDRDTETTVLARDRFGIKPLYYRPGPPLVFASEAGALPSEGGGQLDRAALRDYLTLGFVPSPRTLDPAVQKVRPGTALVVQGGRRTEVRIAEAPRVESGATLEPGELLATLRAAVDRHLMGDVPVGVYLSGGIDSAAIAALVRDTGRPLRTFALTFPGEGRYDEAAAARETAEFLGAAHREVAMGPADMERLLLPAARAFGEPFGDPSALAVLALSLAAREDVTVVLTGTGADELFAGYRRYGLGGVPAACGPLARLAAARLPTSRRTAAGTLGALARKLARTSQRDPAARYLAALEVVPAAWRRALLGDDAPPPVLAALQLAFTPGGAFADAARAADLAAYLPDDVLAKEDRMAMAASLENRVPFLDDAVADAAGRVSARAHRGRSPLSLGKRILRRALAGTLPPAVLNRPKHGFAVPVSEWLRGPCRGLVDGYLTARESHVRELLDPTATDALVTAHRAGDDDLGLAVYALLALEASARVVRGAR